MMGVALGPVGFAIERVLEISLESASFPGCVGDPLGEAEDERQLDAGYRLCGL